MFGNLTKTRPCLPGDYLNNVGFDNFTEAVIPNTSDDVPN